MQCLGGHPAYCANLYDLNFGGTRPDGSTYFADGDAPVSSNFFGQSSFASVTNTYERNIVEVSDDAPLELLGPLGCGVQTGAGAVLNVLRPGPGSSMAIFGTRAAGLSSMFAAIAAGCTNVIMVDIVDSRLHFAEESGATHMVNSSSTDPAEAIKELTDGKGVDYAVDSTGNKIVFPQMLASLGTLGHGALVGAAALGTEAPFDIGTLLLTGLKLSMVIEGDSVPQQFIPKLLRMYDKGSFPFDTLTEQYAFDDINQVFQDSDEGRTLKPVVVL